MLAKRNGFTLIELLVVIAIILVLAAILFPVFASAQRAAQRSTCATHMREVAVAIQTYAGDNAGKPPPACAATPGTTIMYASPPLPLWPSRLKTYLKSQKILLCPSVTPTMISGGYFDNRDPQYPTTYGMNWRFTNGGANSSIPANQGSTRDRNGVVQTLDSPPAPSRTVLLIETQNRIGWVGEGNPPWSGTIPNGGNIMPYSDYGVYFWSIRWHDYPVIPFGHTGGCNVVLADGHVKFIKMPKQTSATITPPETEAAAPIAQNGLTWW